MSIDKDYILDRAFFDLIGTDTEYARTAGGYYEQEGEFIAVYRCMVARDDEGRQSFVIPVKLMEDMGISPGELRDAALYNMDRPEMMEPVLYSVGEVMFDLLAEGVNLPPQNLLRLSEADAADKIASLQQEGVTPLLVLTNRERCFGASELFAPGVAEHLNRITGGFYALPSSVHEWLIVPKPAGFTAEELQEMVREINRKDDCIRPSDVLSNNVYEYDARSRQMRMCDSADALTKQQERGAIKEGRKC